MITVVPATGDDSPDPWMSWMKSGTGPTAAATDNGMKAEISPTATRRGAPARIRLVTLPPRLGSGTAAGAPGRGSTRARPQQTGTSDSPLHGRILPSRLSMNGCSGRPTALRQTAPASLLRSPAGDQEVP